MNTSRDIEKLFDKFGGNAADYQEIGRENEARNARTRWPLLATLDLSQPSIPNIVARRDSLLPQTRDRSGADSSAAADRLTQPTATPISRGKPPLFARAHRRTIPPVAKVALPPATLGAARFAALADTVETTSQAQEPEAQPAAIPVQAFAQATAFGAPMPVSVPEVAPAAPSFASPQSAPAWARPAPPAGKPSLPRIERPAAPQPQTQTPAASSILGKMFSAPAAPASQPAADARSGSLRSMFERLREPAPQADAAQTSGSWLAGRTARS